MTLTVDALGLLVDEVQRLHLVLPAVAGHITSSEEGNADGQLVDAIRYGDRACSLPHGRSLR